MLASFEHIVPTFPLTWTMSSIDVPEFESTWHFHPEFELTYIRAGQGTRLVGDSLADYAPGDLTLIGPEVPHTYVSTPGDHRHSAVVMQFRRDFLGPDFFELPIFASIATLLNGSRRGLSFEIDDEVIARLERAEPSEKTLGLLSLLLDLSHRTPEVLASDEETPALNRVSAQRIESMVRCMHSDFASKLTLADIADAAHLTPSSASRLFSKCTGSSVTLYLNVVRVNEACRLLRDTDRSIAAVALDCGFSNISNFNRRFKDVKMMTPRDYRAGFTLSHVAAPMRPGRARAS